MAVAALVAVAGFFFTRKGPLGVAGPRAPTVVESGRPTPREAYGRGGRARLAILLTSEEGRWLPLVHALDAFGVPFLVTSDWREAVRHRVILTYPILTDWEPSPEARAGIEAAVRDGATLVAVNPFGPSWKDLFGYVEGKPARTRARWTFRPSIALLERFDDPREATVPLTWLHDGRDLDTCGFTGAAETPLADFEDGSAALLRRRVGLGETWAVGIDIGQMAHVSHSLRDEGIERSYVNQYEPAADVFVRLLVALYRRGEPAAVTLGTVPMGRELSVLVTHDVDWLDSVRNALAYAEYERQAGIRATYFLQAKYVSDASEKAFLNRENLPDFRRLAATGHEMASHSVAHSRQYAKFEMGNGRERYPRYRPRVEDAQRTVGGTILGELRVSKFLLDALVGALPVVSFRPGHLGNPTSLPQAMVATGYRFSSSCTANNALTHLPYRLTESRESHVETPIFEFPITVEDEIDPPLLGRLPRALALAETLARHGGLFTILIHPNVVSGKLDFEKGFVSAWKDRAWFGSVSDLGAWWSARDAVEVDADAQARTVTVTAPAPIDGLALRVPPGWRFEHVESGTVAVEPRADGVLLRRLEGEAVLRFATVAAR